MRLPKKLSKEQHLELSILLHNARDNLFNAGNIVAKSYGISDKITKMLGKLVLTLSPIDKILIAMDDKYFYEYHNIKESPYLNVDNYKK